MSSMAKRSHDPCSTGKFTKQNLQTEFSAWYGFLQYMLSFIISSKPKNERITFVITLEKEKGGRGGEEEGRINLIEAKDSTAEEVFPNSFWFWLSLILYLSSLLIEEVQKNDILIIIGETGCGKTTRSFSIKIKEKRLLSIANFHHVLFIPFYYVEIPQFLFGAGFFRDEKVIGITQSRRVAAITVAKWVAEECGVELGQKVSYFVRFDDTTSSSTRIKYMTDGLLLRIADVFLYAYREALLDPYLFEYSIIIFDEVHERTVHTDVLLALLKNVQSAQSRSVADDQSFNFGKKNVNAGISLEKEYGDQSSNFLKKDNHEKYPPLKLIIMSSSIDARTFSEYFGSAKSVHIQGRQFPVDIFYTCHPKEDYFAFIFHLLYLSTDSVILATNIAETSVTIPGVKYVIDPGFVKARSYNSGKDMESLIIVPTSKSQALQKSGRAGCEGPGKCFCLYLKSEFEKLEDSTKPEIKRGHVDNRSNAICGNHILCSPGKKKVEARTAIKCFSSPEGDHITLINVYRASNDFLERRSIEMGKAKKVVRSLRHARDIHRQIRVHAEQMGLNLASCGDDMLQYRRCLAASFFLNAAGLGKWSGGADPPIFYIIPAKIKQVVQNVSSIDYLWLTELAPQILCCEKLNSSWFCQPDGQSAVSTRSLKDFKAFIEQQEQIIRRCYQPKFPHIGSEQFVRIILLDSVFNMELFLREAKGWKHKDDYRDLLLLQNQLPNQVLEKLYETCVPSNLKEHSRFIRLAHEYFASCYPYQKSSKRKFEPKKWEKSLHFTDLSRHTYS
ncbi:hypothetical protein Ahy_B02g058943 isoform B [Arachis hypogaea]|uniref:RNA helicase n=1 Tax=Arachis hypogaea TaxID=3818 RepID=A0A445AFR1_ARAHY|nr:hypothetical protein Ahy_B02g058943 isoform B [Arachis hypogaea]